MLGTMAAGTIHVLLFWEECTDNVMRVLAENNDSTKHVVSMGTIDFVEPLTRRLIDFFVIGCN